MNNEYSNPNNAQPRKSGPGGDKRFEAAIRRAYELWPDIHVLCIRPGNDADGQPHKRPMGTWRDIRITRDDALAHVRRGGRLGLVPWSIRCVVVDCDCGEGKGWPEGAGREVRAAAEGAIGYGPTLALTGSASDWEVLLGTFFH